MTTSNTAAASVQFVQVNQALYILATTSKAKDVKSYLTKTGTKFTEVRHKSGKQQFQIHQITEKTWRSINAIYPCEITGKPMYYMKEGTFYAPKNGTTEYGFNNTYNLGVMAHAAQDVVDELLDAGIKVKNITTWQDRYKGRARLSLTNIPEAIFQNFVSNFGIYLAINPNKPAPKKQAKPAAKEDHWSWGTTNKVPTVTLEQLEAMATSKQATPVEVQPDTDRTPSAQAPDTDSTPVEVQPNTDSIPSVPAPDTDSTSANYAEKVANLATYHDFHSGVRKECVFQLGREHGFPSKNKGTICSKLVALQIYSKNDIKPLLRPGYQL